MTAGKNRWIQGANVKPGALHHQLGYNAGRHIPLGILREIAGSDLGTHIRGRKVTRLLKRRVNFALNVRRK